MNITTIPEISSWCQKKGISVLKHQLVFDGVNGREFSIKLPKAASELTALAFSLLNVNPQSNFQGAMLWIRDWGMGNSDLDQSGIAILQQMRRSHGKEQPLAEAPGHLFLEDEWLDLYAFLLIPLWYQWDAFLVEASGNGILSLSHEGHLRMSFKESLWFESTRKALEGWNPKNS